MKDYYFLCDVDGDIPASKQGAYMYRSFAQAQRYGKGKFNWYGKSEPSFALHVQWDGKQFNAMGIEEL